MSLRMLFWLLMILWLVVFGVANFGPVGYQHYSYSGGGLLTFLLFVILGWQAFGKPID